MNETSLFARAVQVLVPEPCYTKIFTNFDFFDAACFSIILSKGLGFSIIAGSVLVKLPQIMKMVVAKSGEGISFMSVLFELMAISANLAYSFAQGYPFSAYGEAVFLSIQTSMVLFLVIYFGGNFLGAFMFLVVYGGLLSYLMSPMAPIILLEFIQGVNIFIIILSKMLQIVANYRNSSTGQLSGITVGLIFLGSVGRVFTSIKETGDQLVILQYCIASLLNGVIVAQLFFYKDSKQKKA